MLERLSSRDPATARHSAAVARFSRELCRQAGGDREDQELVHQSALLHDIGKATFPDHILFSRRRLLPLDWEVIRSHPEEGALIVSEALGLPAVAEVILCHHERIDGRGYPRGLCGDEIPLLARIVSIADTYDVMTARDSYRLPVSRDAALAELERVRDTQLDGWLVDLFVEMVQAGGLAFGHGNDADYRVELAFEKRVSLRRRRAGVTLAG